MKFPREEINFIFDDGGVGDNVARMPCLRYIKDHFPWVTPYLWTPDYFLEFARNIAPDIKIYPFSQGYKKFKDKIPGRQTTMKHHDTLSTHLTDHAFHVLANRQVKIENKNYLPLRNIDGIDITRFNLPKEYVVMTTGFTAPIREFLPQKVNTIVQYLNERNMSVVFLGSKQAITGGMSQDITGNFNTEIDYSKGLNLVDQTSLLEAAKIIAQSKAIIGLDNGLLHLAACSDVPIIGGFTSVDPWLRNPYRHNELGWNCYNVVPPDSEPEKFFQSRMDFLYEHDYRYSFYKNNNLIESLPTEDFIKYLEEVLK